MAVPSDLAAQLDRVRLESGTLYDLIAIVASSPDLDRVLDGVVDLLTKATSCHACFVYLRLDDRLRLRAASRPYAHLVGRVEFGVDEGLAGWSVRRNELGFIRESALADPRVVFVPELEEERFQSMIAVPIPTRGGEAMGAIVLHTIAPREFEEGTLNLLAHAAPLVAGPIENARLLEDARQRVDALTSLSALSQRIAAAGDRADLYHAASEGVRALLRCEQVRLYELDADRRRLQLVAADPPAPGAAPAPASAAGVLLDLLHRTPDDASLRAALGLDAGADRLLAAPVAAGDEHLGVLVAAGTTPWPPGTQALLRAIANQVAVALKQAELIERLTEENVVRDLFGALERGQVESAEAQAGRVRWQPERPHVFVDAQPARDTTGTVTWPELAERTERELRRVVPGALCDAGDEHVRALLPMTSGADEELATLDAALARIGAAHALGIGRSGVHGAVVEARAGLREAADAASAAATLQPTGGAIAYADLGAYRYLIPLLGDEIPPDRYVGAVRALQEYDRRRGSELVATLERYLADRGGVTETARALSVHPNTLRQRLERIESLTDVRLADADLLALELALKLARLRPTA